MPVSFLPSVEQGGNHTKEGVFLFGDSWNTRHPLTGGGMTVAFNDVVLLAQMLGEVENYNNWDQISDILARWYWVRKPSAFTMNIMGVALYDLFGADGMYNLGNFCDVEIHGRIGERLAILQNGCFKYLECGGDCIHGAASLLSG